MGHQYTPRHFLRQASNGLLKSYFDRRKEDGVDTSNWRLLGSSAKEKETIYNAWRKLPPERIRQIESEFQAIYDLATEDGVRTIMEEAVVLAPEALETLRLEGGFVTKVFWVFLRHPRLFAHVSKCDHANRLSRSWKKRKGLPKKAPDMSDAAVDALAAEIGRYYWEHQGRGGENCRGESFLRGDNRAYVFVYPQDYADTFIGYDKDGTFVRVPQQPAFEIVFAFDPAVGVLDLYAKADKRVKQALEEMFGRHILHEDVGPEPLDNDAHRLDRLKDRSFAMPTDPQDNIRQARVKTLRLSLPDGQGLIVVDTPAQAESPHAVYDNMDEYLDTRQIARDSVRVGAATIQMTVGGNGEGGEKRFEFHVSARSARNASRDRPEDQLARKYLKLWEIANE